MRGAISAANRAYQWHYRFNPRPSCEGRPDSAVLVGILDGSFNPRPSCEGRLGGLGHINALEVFQSTPLMRGATIDVSGYFRYFEVSIHAPHARGDHV